MQLACVFMQVLLNSHRGTNQLVYCINLRFQCHAGHSRPARRLLRQSGQVHKPTTRTCIGLRQPVHERIKNVIADKSTGRI